MKNLQKLGGFAALYSGLAYIIGIIGFIFILGTNEVVDPIQKVVVLVENQVGLHLLHLLVFQIWAVVLVILALSLNEKLKDQSPVMIQITTIIGFIWACVVIASGMIYNVGMDTVVNLYTDNPEQAATVWASIHSVFDGLGGGNEILGGIWLLLVSIVALRADKFNRILNSIGLLIGIVGIISSFPGLGELGMIFGLGQIIWFVWLGIILLKKNQQ